MNNLFPATFVNTLKLLQPFENGIENHLTGIHGSNRESEKPCQIHAHHDYEAIQCWLNEYKQKETTYRSYQKEGERLLLWCVLQQKKPLSNLTRDDFETYFAFLDNPQPKALWCASKGGRHKKRGESGWRPFVGPLSSDAKSNAITVINSLMTYLVDARYLAFNPLLLIRKKKKRNPNVENQQVMLLERILEADEWQALLDSIEEIPKEKRKEKERTRFLIAILLLLGLRADELVKHRWNAFRKIGDEWWFLVIGKGDKPGMIPVNDELINQVIHYRTFLGKTPLPFAEDDSPLIHSFASNDTSLSARQINNVIKSVIEITIKKFTDQPDKIRKLKKVSAHWFRHLSATLQYESGIDEKHIQYNLRHSKRTTTQQYNHALLKKRHQEMQKLKLHRSSSALRDTKHDSEFA